MASYRGRQLAFTVFELLLCMLLLVILMLVAIPNWRRFTDQQQLNSAVRRIEMGLTLARTLAVKLGDEVSYCASSDNSTCSGSWSQGQLVVSKQQAERVFAALPKQVVIAWKGTGSSKRIIWQADGSTKGQQGSFYLCMKNDSSINARIVLVHSGRIRLQQPDSKAAKYCK